MSVEIIDGRTRRTLRIDNNNRATVTAFTEPFADRAAELGDRYNVNTGVVTLNSAGESAMLYLKNNEDDDLVINSIIYNLGVSTNGSGSCLVDVYRNPTSGTIVSDASAVDAVSNMNFGSNKTLSNLLAYTGGQSKTQTGGTFSIGSVLGAGSRAVIALGALTLPKGSSLAVTITPPAGNTSMVVNVAAACYLAADEVTGGTN